MLWNKMCYLKEEAPKDFLGDELLRELIGEDLEYTELAS